MRDRRVLTASHEAGHYLLAKHHGVRSHCLVLLRTSRTKNPHLWRCKADSKDHDIDICLGGWAAEALVYSGEENLRRFPFFIAAWKVRRGAGLDRKAVAELAPELKVFAVYRRLYLIAKLVTADLERLRRMRHQLLENQFMNHAFLEAVYHDRPISFELDQINRQEKVSDTFSHELKAAGLSLFLGP